MQEKGRLEVPEREEAQKLKACVFIALVWVFLTQHVTWDFSHTPFLNAPTTRVCYWFSRAPSYFLNVLRNRKGCVFGLGHCVSFGTLHEEKSVPWRPPPASKTQGAKTGTQRAREDPPTEGRGTGRVPSAHRPRNCLWVRAPSATDRGIACGSASCPRSG